MTPSPQQHSSLHRRADEDQLRTGGRCITHNKKSPTLFKGQNPTSNNHKASVPPSCTRELKADKDLAGIKARAAGAPRHQGTTKVQNDQNVRSNIHDRSLALTRCPLCNNLELSEWQDTVGESGPIRCASCGTLDNTHQDTARRRQRKVIQAIFIPDHIVDINPSLIPTLGTHDNPHTTDPTRAGNQTQHYKKTQQPPDRTTAAQDTRMTPRSDSDLTLKGVPEYADTDDGHDGQEDSLKNLIKSLRADFQAVGRKVDAVEKNLGTTQTKEDGLVGQINEVTEGQETFREETRAAAKKTTSAIKRLQEAQNKIEAKQDQALNKLQAQVLKEPDDKVGSMTNQQNHPNPPNHGSAANDE